MMMKNFFLLILLYPFLGYTQNIKTIQFRPANSDSYSPIVPLGNTLELSFDDLDADNKQYQYKIQHMTYDWQPSNLIANQYVNGFNSDYINDVTNSFNTLQDYTHYKINIPNENTKIIKSGNYLISIFNDDDDVVFTRRCVFYEKLTSIGITVERSRDLKTVNEQQRVLFTVNYNDLSINNPDQEIKVTLLQNNNWQTAITNLKPLFFKTNQLVYNHIKETNFWGNNEFYNFDSKNIRNTSLNIARTERKNIFHHYLYTNEIKRHKTYSFQPDINGEFVIRNIESDEPDTEADYAATHFYLKTDTPYDNKDVYVYGNFNNYELSEENKMIFNERENIYEAVIPFKQGFYNYNYVTVNQNNIVNLHEISGSFYETENQYTVIVYYRPFGSMFDRVIGVGNGFFDQNR